MRIGSSTKDQGGPLVADAGTVSRRIGEIGCQREPHRHRIRSDDTAGAVAAINDQEHFATTSQAVIRSREALRSSLLQLGFEVLPSAANFIFTRHPQYGAGQIAAALRERGIIVRHFKLPRIDQHLRITIGSDEQCQILVEALSEILQFVRSG